MSDLMEKIKPIIEPFNILLRGVGQVVFQGNALSGLIILIGIFVAFYLCWDCSSGWFDSRYSNCSLTKS